jgi:HEAT repeat protein
MTPYETLLREQQYKTLIRDPDPQARTSAAHAFGGRGEIHVLAYALSQERVVTVRLAIVNALARCNELDALWALGDALSDPDPMLRCSTISAITICYLRICMDKDYLRSEAISTAKSLVARVINDPVPFVSERARSMLQEADNL